MLTQVGAQDAAAKVRFSWVFAVASVGPFMAALDNLMVTTALPMIMKGPRTPACQRLGWLVNARGMQAAGSAVVKSLVLLSAAAPGVLGGHLWAGKAGARLGFVLGLLADRVEVQVVRWARILWLKRPAGVIVLPWGPGVAGCRPAAVAARPGFRGFVLAGAGLGGL